MKDYDKNKELLYLQYWDVKNLYGCAVSQTFPINNVHWIKDRFHKKKYNEEMDEEYFLEVEVQYLEKLHEYT